jgi:hypothetical protein
MNGDVRHETMLATRTLQRRAANHALREQHDLDWWRGWLPRFIRSWIAYEEKEQ